MIKTFPGFPKQSLTFFRQLAKNNKREWFQPRKPLYDQYIHVPMLELLGQVTDDLRKFASDYAVEPKKAIYRLYRDTRFSKDKTPYKNNVSAMFFPPAVGKNNGAGFYFHVSPEEVMIAGGMYNPGPVELTGVRNAIAKDNGKTLQKLLANPGLKKAVGKPLGDKFTRVPKSFDPDHPAADLLRLKQLYFAVSRPAKIALGPSIRKEIVSRFQAMTPIVTYLNNAILIALRDEDEVVNAIPKRPKPMF